MDYVNENLLTCNWREFCPGSATESTLQTIALKEGGVLNTTLSGECDYRIWQGYADKVMGGSPYQFSVEYKQERVECESKSIYAILSWFDYAGVLIERNYAEHIAPLYDGWKRLETIIETPENAASAKIDLALRWAPGGSVSWRAPFLSRRPPRKHRIVNVATTFMNCTEDPEKNLWTMKDVAASAGSRGADIICLSETPYNHTVRIPLDRISQPIPGKLTDSMAETAKCFGSYVIFSMHEKCEEKIYNTAVLINRNGDIAGKYRKIHIPLAEAEEGVSPGAEWGVFDTDFGRIGIMICWDQVFPEVARTLAILGAEIIFVPTIGDEPLQQAARAKDNGVYVVVSGMYGPVSSRIIDPNGAIVGTAADGESGVFVTKIDLDMRHYTHWLSLGPCNCEAHSVYMKERRSDLYDIICQRHP
jgi:predicted amidohydrolase